MNVRKWGGSRRPAFVLKRVESGRNDVQLWRVAAEVVIRPSRYQRQSLSIPREPRVQTLDTCIIRVLQQEKAGVGSPRGGVHFHLKLLNAAAFGGFEYHHDAFKGARRHGYLRSG